MNILNIQKNILRAKEEAEIGSPERAETYLFLAIQDITELSIALKTAKNHLENGDPVESVSVLDLITKETL